MLRIHLPIMGRGRDLERGFAPLLLIFPPSLTKGRGQGDRLLNNLEEKVIGRYVTILTE
jgi:hypothetical protein